MLTNLEMSFLRLIMRAQIKQHHMRQLKITKQVTNRETKSLNSYLQDVSKIDMITAEEEVELAQRIREGDKGALDKLTRANLRFVISVAKQYQNQGLSLPDLINEGNVGLVKAAKRFDETRGFKFISYAVWWIRQSILQAIAEQSRIVRLPLNKIGDINKVKKASIHLQQVYERIPTAQEIANELDITVASVKSSMKNSNRSISMDAPFQEGENDNNLYDVISSGESPNPDNGLMQESLKTEIDRALDTLSQREADVVKLNFGLSGNPVMTLQEIGDTFDLSRERVRQIREKAIRRLRHESKSHILMKYLG
jgi:RNA polymerase primary sigma factor